MARWSIVNCSLISNHSGRIDAEYYKPESLEAYNSVKKGNYKLLGQLVQEGYRVVYENTKILKPDKVNKEKDVRFLQATNVSEDGLWINPEEIGYVSETDWDKYPKGRIKHGEILIEVKGQAEKVTIVQSYMPLRTLVTGTLFKLTVNEKLISPEYIFTFFSCRYGKILRDRIKVNTLIYYVSKPELYNIPIPIFNDHIEEITSLIKDSYKCSVLSNELYQKAEKSLNDELHLSAVYPSKQKWYTTTYCDVLGERRIDSEYYHPKYFAIEEDLRSYKNGTGRLGNYFTENKSVVSYKNSRYKYIEIGDVNVSDGTYIYKELNKSDIPAGGKIELKKGDVLISTVRPYRGAVTIIDEELPDLIGSSAFTVVRELKGYKKEVLLLLLRMECYKTLLMKWNVGTTYPVIKNEDILSLIIPIIPMDIQEKIALGIKKSYALKKRSKILLNRAKHRIEELIEQGVGK